MSIETCLRLSSGTTTIVRGTQLLDVPAGCAERCTLMQDILQQESTTDLPLPLSMKEVLAWLTRAQQDEAIADSSDEHVELKDGLLLDALKARSLD